MNRGQVSKCERVNGNNGNDCDDRSENGTRSGSSLRWYVGV